MIVSQFHDLALPPRGRTTDGVGDFQALHALTQGLGDLVEQADLEGRLSH